MESAKKSLLAFVLSVVCFQIPVMIGAFCLFKANTYGGNYETKDLYIAWINFGLLATFPGCVIAGLPSLIMSIGLSPGGDRLDVGILQYAIFWAFIINLMAGTYIGLLLESRIEKSRVNSE